MDPQYADDLLRWCGPNFEDLLEEDREICTGTILVSVDQDSRISVLSQIWSDCADDEKPNLVSTMDFRAASEGYVAWGGPSYPGRSLGPALPGKWRWSGRVVSHQIMILNREPGDREIVQYYAGEWIRDDG